MKFRERVEKMSQGPSVFFLGKFFFFLYGMETFWEEKKSPNFFSFSILYGMALILVINSEKFRKMVGFGLVFLLAWTPQAGRATRQCPHDATSGGKEATDCRCRHHGESESSGRSSNNPWHHRFRTPKLVAAHGERSRRKPFRKFWPNHRAWDPPSAKPPPQTL